MYSFYKGLSQETLIACDTEVSTGPILLSLWPLANYLGVDWELISLGESILQWPCAYTKASVVG